VGISLQAFGILRKIAEVDRVMTPAMQSQVFEVHPELSFLAMAGHPARHGKKSAAGRAERRARLAAAGFSQVPMTLRGAAPDDLLDAAAACWSAARIRSGTAVRLPAGVPSLKWPWTAHGDLALKPRRLVPLAARCRILLCVDGRARENAERIRSLIERGQHDPATFRAALLEVAPLDRDAWVDLVLGLGPLPDDVALPRECVPYLPCSVDVLLRTVEQAPVRVSDVFVDAGSGLGRAALLVHLLTGATAIGLEIQPHLVLLARDLLARFLISRVSIIEGDAPELTGFVTTGSVFFLYCPFAGDRLARFLAGLEPLARTRRLSVCSVDLPLPPRPWLALDPPLSGDLRVYRAEKDL
jgi:hypothetical protein